MLSSPSTPPRLSHIPGPTIRYLMAWTALTAFVLVVFTRGLGASTPDAISGGFLALAATVVGWIYMGGLLILRHAARGTLWPLEPGEWLILAAINILTVLCVIGLVNNWELWPESDAYFAFHRWVDWMAWLIPAEFALVFVVPAVIQRKRWVWSALFWTLTLPCWSFYVMVFVDEMINLRMNTVALTALSIVGGSAMLLLGLLVASVISDRRRRDPRHWLHWSAVVLSGLGLISILVMVVIIFVQI